MRTAEACDQAGVELVRLVARELAFTEGLDARRVDDADPDAWRVQVVGKLQPPIAGRLHAGVQRDGRIGPMLGQPRQQLLEPSFSIGEDGVPDALAQQQSGVELGFADVDADDVHGPSTVMT